MGGKHSTDKGADSEIVRVVCKEHDIKDNEMKEYTIEGHKLILVKQNGKLSALGPKCTHYGAPLSTGVLGNGRIRCPWHGACFNTTTGDIEDFPGLDSLPCYRVNVENGDIKVYVKADQLEEVKRVRIMSKHDRNNANTIIVIGGGGAGQVCVETLRTNGYTGRVVLVTKERDLPYDRPKLSKALDSTGAKLALRKPEFYPSNDIETMTEKEVIGVDVENKTVQLNSGEKIKFSSLVVATGGKPRSLDIPGSDLINVCILRTPDDGNLIAKASAGKKIVIVGVGFIGMEVAAYLNGKASSVTLIGNSKVPFQAVFGPAIGKQLMEFFQSKGIEFRMESGVSKLTGESGVLQQVHLSNGDILDADVCIVAVGVIPATEFLKDTGVQLDERGFVVVDRSLQSSVPGIYAAGDIASFPLFLTPGKNASIGHWQMAMAHGRAVALNIIGETKEDIKSVPFFWSVLFGKSLRFAGYCPSFDEIIVNGDLPEMKFAAFYIKNGKICAIATLGRDPLAARFAEMIASGRQLTVAEIHEIC